MIASLLEGTVFAGRYRIIRCIAAGGMGAVYEVAHLETERRRALKVMHPHLFQNDEMRQRFKREARITAQVESDYIVDVFDAGLDEATGIPYLVMELLRGEELGKRLERMGRLPAAEVLTYLHQVAGALDKTHAASIVHRDLKPENLFVIQRDDGSTRIKILDFGVAKLVAESATGAATRSLGTPLYMAPEQFRSNTRLTGAADIYALGMVAYTLLVGEPYWAAEARSTGDVIAFAMVVIRGVVDPPVGRASARGVALPPYFDAWFGKATAVNPLERFPTATEAVRALVEVMEIKAEASAMWMPPITMIAVPRTTPATLTPVSARGVAPLATSGHIDSESGPSPVLPPPTVTSPNSAVAHAPVTRSRALLVAFLSAVLGTVGVGSWAALHDRAPAEASTETAVALPASPATGSDSSAAVASAATAATPPVESLASAASTAPAVVPPVTGPRKPAIPMLGTPSPRSSAASAVTKPRPATTRDTIGY